MNALKLGVIVSKSTAICLAKIDFKQEQLKKPFLYRDWCHKQMQKYGTRNSHVTCNIQSDCFNLELKGNASLKFVWHWRLAFFYIHTGTVSKKLFDSILANKSRRTKLGALKFSFKCKSIRLQWSQMIASPFQQFLNSLYCIINVLSF